MSDNRISQNGNFVSEDGMSSTALVEAKGWYDDLMAREFRGRGDREKSARGRVADKIGVPETWLFDLQYKSQGKKDVRGALYRALMLGIRKYDALCQANEDAADRYKAERLNIRGNHEKADEKPASAGLGMDSSKA